MKNLKQTLLGAFTIMALSIQSKPTGKVDASHSKLGFLVTHLMVSETEGRFKLYEGTVSSKLETDFTDAKIDFSVDVSSINTDDEKRDGHLKGADFFDVEKFPKITFKATSMKPEKLKVLMIWKAI